MKPPITPETLAALDAAGYAVVPMWAKGRIAGCEKAIPTQINEPELEVLWCACVNKCRLRPSDLEDDHG